MKSVTILGSTGSIGQSTLSVIEKHPDKFSVYAVTAHTNAEKLGEVAKKYNAKVAVIADSSKHDALKDTLKGTDIKALSGQEGVIEATNHKVDITMAAIMGMAGLLPTLEAIKHGNIVAFASKEALVGAGNLMMDAVKQYGTSFLPVDSEHNAIFQVWSNKQDFEKIILTGSGGPFRENTIEEMEIATPEQAIAHPNWSMGAKISVDSATMMNKALELIEACYLFDVPHEKIEIMIHPQSIVHSMVEYKDGSVLAQLGAPDMCTPITYCLGYPERLETPGNTLSLSDLSKLSFEAPNDTKFPALPLARKALDQGPGSCIALNASNEVSVAAFLNNDIGFNDIVRINEYVVNTFKTKTPHTLKEVIEIDAKTRNLVQELLNTNSYKKLRA